MRIFIPLEVVDREYSSRLLVAAEAAKRGAEVTFGHQNPVYKSAVTEGNSDSVWLGRGSVDQALLTRGISLAGHDEESGIIYDSYHDYYRLRPGLKEIGSTERFFCWGPDDYEYLAGLDAKRSGYKRARFPKTGSHRSALWGRLGRDFYKNEIRLIQRKYCNYILFVSNFAHGNSVLGQNVTDFLQRLGNWENIGHAVNAVIMKEKRLMKCYLRCAAGLAKRTGLNIVIRPHPVESAEVWYKETKTFKNVHIVSGGSLSPWIHAAEAIIHNSCTSGVEAACIGRPAISLGDHRGDFESVGGNFANRISIIAEGEEKLYQVFDKLATHWSEDEVQRDSMLERKLFDYGRLSSIQGLVSELFEIERSQNVENEKISKRNMLRGYGDIKKSVKTVLPALTARERLNRQKAAEISLSKIKEDLLVCSDLMDLGKRLQVEMIKKNMFKIKA